MNDSGTTRSKRPLWLKLLAFSLLILAMLGWMRVFESIVRWQEFIAIGMQPGPWYTAFSGLLTGGLALIASIGIWLRARWAPAFTRGFVLIWLAWLWFDRFFIALAPGARVNWPFLLGASVVGLGAVFLALHLGRDRFL